MYEISPGKKHKDKRPTIHSDLKKIKTPIKAVNIRNNRYDTQQYNESATSSVPNGKRRRTTQSSIIRPFKRHILDLFDTDGE